MLFTGAGCSCLREEGKCRIPSERFELLVRRGDLLQVHTTIVTTVGGDYRRHRLRVERAVKRVAREVVVHHVRRHPVEKGQMLGRDQLPRYGLLKQTLEFFREARER